MVRALALATIISTASAGAVAVAAPPNLPMCEAADIARIRELTSRDHLNPVVLDQVGGLVATTKSRSAYAFPAAGETHSVEVGQSMISHLNYTVYDGTLTLRTPLAFSGLPPISPRPKHRFRISVPTGTFLASRGFGFKDETLNYKVTDSPPLREKDGEPYLDFAIGLIPAGPDEIRVVWGKGAEQWSTGPVKADYSVNQCGVWTEGDFRRELVYSGISQGTVLITYREYLADLARPSYTQELRYDLKEGTEVGFRGARFEILKASNTEISYRVIKPLE